MGLKMAGFKFDWVGFSEIDKYAIKVYQKNFPDAENLGDITKIDGHEIKERIGEIDLITGGFPCQDISVSGKGAGITGSRSGLWKEMFRLICEIRPRFVIVENVSALLGRGLDTIFGDLASCGYDAEWDCIPALAVGAHHQRDRIWIVAYPNSIRFNISKDEEKKHFKNNKKTWGNNSLELYIDILGHSYQCIPKNLRMDNGIPIKLDRIKCLGNSVVPQVVEWIGRRLLKVMEND